MSCLKAYKFFMASHYKYMLLLLLLLMEGCEFESQPSHTKDLVIDILS